ncbi:MAG: GTPase HflX [Dehalococcoidia bacterium]|nr:GTPase HflX [Dehalococcoidia bacterium]
MVGVETRESRLAWSGESSIDELGHLAVAAGAEVVGRVLQKLPRVSPTHYLGEGKLQILTSLKTTNPYTVAIFDDELTPRQQRNIENILKVKVIDRTALILDIFARRAKTREGQLQVELAQHRYLLPRLAGQWSHLERLGGGIGTRGPGESQLETDRRLIRDRIKRLEQKLEEVRKHRALYQQRRQKMSVPVVALVGYTHTGKSTLLNSLTGAGVPVTHTLFSTLDPVTRRIRLPDGRFFLLTDTVGFIQKLPPTVVAAFRATLEELQNASLLLHIVDITHPEASRHCQTVEEVLRSLGLKDTPRLTVLNKMDLAVGSEEAMRNFDLYARLGDISGIRPDNILFVSAKQGWGFSQLLQKISEMLPENSADSAC